MDTIDQKGTLNPSKQILFKLPQVQLIGAQKSGTSAVADWLFENGRFCRPKILGDEPFYYTKEVHFFDIEWRYNQGIEFYAKRFQDGNLYLDATPDTLPFPDRVRATYEEAGGNQVATVKFIAILREPVSRELSLYNHLAYDCRTLCKSERTEWHNQVLNHDGSIISFDEFVCQISIPALEREDGPGQSSRHSMYAKHLTKWFQVFDRKQILLLSYHELKNHPEKLQQRINEFLNMKIPGKLMQSNALDSPLKVQSPSLASSQRLHVFFKPHNKKLEQLLALNPGPPMEKRQLMFHDFNSDDKAVSRRDSKKTCHYLSL